MTEAELTDLLRKVAAGELTPEAATRQIQSPPKKRGRPPAPLGESRMGMVWVFYILFDVHHLKMMDLRGLLAEASRVRQLAT